MKTIYKIITIVVLLISSANLFAQNKYEYKIDLTKVKKDKIQVHLKTPEIKEKETLFCFPASVPGTYTISNYGNIIENLKAFDSQGNQLKVSKINTNCYQIQQADKLTDITYWVNDSWDSKKGKKIFDLEGVKFEKDEVFLLNNGCMFGYFKGKKNILFDLKIQKPETLFGLTTLQTAISEKELQTFIAEDYDELVDNPILFTEPDTASFKINNTNITISVFNESGKKSAQIIKENILPEFKAIEKFIPEKYPVENYQILVYLEDFTDVWEALEDKKVTLFSVLTKILMKHGIPDIGALEHGKSSFHYYIDYGYPESYMYLLKSVIIHEFMHTYTPLNLHSELIGNFDYQNPKASKHLWLYEGIPSYFADLVRLKDGIIDLNEFLNTKTRTKLVQANRFPEDLSYTDFSENVMQKDYNKMFVQVYKRGYILAMLLDIEIMHLTKGQKQLKDVLLTLSSRYGNKSFSEEDFIKEFVAEVHQDLQLFFNKYITGNEPIDYKMAYEKAGILYETKVEQQVPENIFGGGLGVKKQMQTIGFYSINKVDKGSPFQVGDKIESELLGYYAMKPFRNGLSTFYNTGDTIQLPVWRKGKKITLNIPIKMKETTYYHKFTLIENMTPEQEKVFMTWTTNK